MTASRRSRDEIDTLVLSHLIRAAGPASAYDIAAAATDKGEPLHPNQVYRTLDRLIGQGRAYRVETLAAYVALSGPADTCLVCTGCRSARLLCDARSGARLAKLARAHGFQADRTVVELLGTCPACRKGRASRRSMTNPLTGVPPCA